MSDLCRSLVSAPNFVHFWQLAEAGPFDEELGTIPSFFEKN